MKNYFLYCISSNKGSFIATKREYFAIDLKHVYAIYVVVMSSNLQPCIFYLTCTTK